MATIITPPKPLTKAVLKDRFTVFLAGSIEMGKAEDWQATVCNSLKDRNLNVLNPRREDWDSSWKQDKDNPKFREQVEWELEGLEKASMIACYIDPKTKAPITLLELGKHADAGKTVLCCPKGFWRKGNIDIFCERYNIPQVDSLVDLIADIMRADSEVLKRANLNKSPQRWP